MAIIRTIKFKNGAIVHIDDEFMQKGVDRIETDKWIVTKQKRDYSENPDILEVIEY